MVGPYPSLIDKMELENIYQNCADKRGSRILLLSICDNRELQIGIGDGMCDHVTAAYPHNVFHPVGCTSSRKQRRWTHIAIANHYCAYHRPAWPQSGPGGPAASVACHGPKKQLAFNAFRSFGVLQVIVSNHFKGLESTLQFRFSS